jgi:hypothetical protein
MAGYRPEGPIDPHVSLYLQRPLRSLREAQQDNDASAGHSMSLPSPSEPLALPPPASSVHQDAASPVHSVIITL